MIWSVVQVTAPSVYAITLAEAKDHLNINFSDKDDKVTRAIQGAISEIDGPDGWLGRSLITQTLRLRMNEFPDDDQAIRLPLPPLISVSSIVYIDGDGVTQTVVPVGSPAAFADYDVLTDREPGELRMKYSKTWPGTRDTHEAVTINYIAGYGASGTNVPGDIRAYLLMRAGDLFRFSESMVVGVSVANLEFVKTMLHKYRLEYAGPVELS